MSILFNNKKINNNINKKINNVHVSRKTILNDVHKRIKECTIETLFDVSLCDLYGFYVDLCAHIYSINQELIIFSNNEERSKLCDYIKQNYDISQFCIELTASKSSINIENIPNFVMTQNEIKNLLNNFDLDETKNEILSLIEMIDDVNNAYQAILNKLNEIILSSN